MSLPAGLSFTEVDSVSWILLLITAVICWVLITDGLSWRNAPPGPRGVPIVGYLPWLNPKAPYKTLHDLAMKYGKIYSLKLGSIKVVVMSDPEMIRRTLSLEATTGRAPLYLTHGIMKGYGLVCSEGNLWKEHRKFVLGFMRAMGMRTPATSDAIEVRVQTVATKLMQELRKNSGSPSGINVGDILLHYMGNTMNELIFGLTYREDDPTWRWLRFLLEEGIKFVGIAGPLNFLPWLRFLPKYKRIIKFIKENQEKTHLEYRKIVSHHEKQIQSTLSRRMTSSNKAGLAMSSNDAPAHARPPMVDEESNKEPARKTPPLHIIDAYVRERQTRGNEEGTFTYTQLNHVAADLFGAGTETTLTTLKWHLLDLALHPEVQERVRQEVFSVLGERTQISVKDFPLLPYTVSAIMETQRLRSVVPLGVPHGTITDISTGGYRIPKGTMILPLLWTVHRHPDYWNDPEHYYPERFLDSSGNVQKLTAFMPFQTGRRMCIGDEFAKMLLVTFTTRIVTEFSFTLPGRNNAQHNLTAFERRPINEDDKDGKQKDSTETANAADDEVVDEKYHDLMESKHTSSLDTTHRKKSTEGEACLDDPSTDPVCGFTLSPRPFKLIFTSIINQKTA